MTEIAVGDLMTIIIRLDSVKFDDAGLRKFMEDEVPGRIFCMLCSINKYSLKKSISRII